MSSIKKMVITALFIALGIVLPLAFHAIPNAGLILLPMHIPILLCGIICGFPYGLACGLITPALASLLTGMPPVFILPAMLCELATYGLISSLLIKYVRLKNIYTRIYVALIGAMLIGRVIFGALNALIFSAGEYTMEIWLSAAFVTALPGIAIQIVIIPVIIIVLQKANLITLDGASSAKPVDEAVA